MLCAFYCCPCFSNSASHCNQNKAPNPHHVHRSPGELALASSLIPSFHFRPYLLSSAMLNFLLPPKYVEFTSRRPLPCSSFCLEGSDYPRYPLTSRSIRLLDITIFTALMRACLCVYCLSFPIRTLVPRDYFNRCCIPNVCTQQLLY